MADDPNESAPLAAELVQLHGWDAHAEIHRRHDAWLDALYGLIDRPLACNAVAGVLEKLLLAHLRFEEKHVLPVYRERVAPDAPAAIAQEYAEDHLQVQHAVGRIRESSVRLAAEDVDPSVLRQAIVRLDEVLEHHDHREMSHLYPALAEALRDDEKQKLMAAFARQPLCDARQVVPALTEAIEKDAVLCELEMRYMAWRELRDGSRDPVIPRTAFSVPYLDVEPAPERSVALLFDRLAELGTSFSQATFDSVRQRAREEARLEAMWRTLLRLATLSVGKRFPFLSWM